jgi:hypothetical protein
MNRNGLKKMVGHRVRLRPRSVRFDGTGRHLLSRDDVWIVAAVHQKGVEIHRINPPTFVYTMGFDHIYAYSTDPNRETDGLRHGILRLNGRLMIWPERVDFEPG